MLFGKPAPSEEIDLSELEAYLNKCFEGKLRRLSTRAPETERDLAKEFSSFAYAIKAFSESTAGPDMEYLYGIKENYIRSQKPNYSSSLLHIAAVKPAYDGTNIYFRSESMLQAYNKFIIEVMRANNTFRLVMMAYAGELSDTKAHFNTMERLCKELSLELSSCSQQLNEYKELDNKIRAMQDRLSKIELLKRSLGGGPEKEQHQEGAGNDIAAQIREKENQLELARRRHNEANLSLTGLLLPLERVARKHDHMSPSKRKLTDYIKEPAVVIRTPEDAKELGKQISAVIEEVRSGSMDIKNPDGLVLQLSAIKDRDFLALAESLRERDTEVRKLQEEMKKLQTGLHEVEKSRDAKRRMLEEKGETEKEIIRQSESVSAAKKEIEWLLHNYYKRQVLIKIGADYGSNPERN